MTNWCHRQAKQSYLKVKDEGLHGGMAPCDDTVDDDTMCVFMTKHAVIYE